MKAISKMYYLNFIIEAGFDSAQNRLLHICLPTCNENPPFNERPGDGIRSRPRQPREQQESIAWFNPRWEIQHPLSSMCP